MKIISFNLHFGGKTGEGNPWRRALADFVPEIICAQETRDPLTYFEATQLARAKACLWRRVPGVLWGSAILSTSYRLEELSLDAFEGWVVGARVPDLVIGDQGLPLTIFSIHAPSPGPYLPQVNKILDEIAAKWDGGPLLLAGDFNVTTAKRRPSEEMQNSPGETALLDRLEREFGLHNAWQALHPNQDLPQTLRWNNDPSVPFHCDAIFVDSRCLGSLSSAEIVASSIWGSASDHNPVVVEFK